MAMRLLPKSEVAKAKANSQKREIDEGVKLAKRVDGLRQVVSQEEAALKKFREESIEALHKELAPLHEEKERLTVEVKDLKEQRKALLVPLDKEWTAVAKAKQQIAHDTANANALAETAQNAVRDADRAIKRAADALARAITKEDSAGESLKNAAAHEREAKRAVLAAKAIEAKALRLAERVEADLRARDNVVALRESSVTLREANLKEGEAELENGWKLLNDRKAMLERNIKRANS